MELALYLSLVGVSVLLAVANPLMRSSAFLVIAFPVAVTFGLGVRMLGFEHDILTYADRMRAGATTSFYFAREPVVWFGQTILYRLTGSEIISFVVLDCLGLAAVFGAFHLMKMPRYVYFAFLTFFPFILGFQNIYRQWLGMCFILLALALLPRLRSASFGAAVVAALSHNAAAVFAGMLAPLWPSRFRQLLTLAAFLVLPFAIYYGGESKSDWGTGLSLQYVYPVVIAIGALSIMTLEAAGGISRERLPLYVSMVFAVETSILAGLFLASAGAERVSMFAMFMIYPFAALAIERCPIRPRWLLRVIFVISGFAPILLFGTREFIL